MIYTVTFNPSLDYIIQVDHFTSGQINKTTYENILPGGKGINVSIVLSNLCHASCALGFTAGFTGEEIKRRMKNYGCQTDFIEVSNGLSRINVKMKSDEETEINGAGPDISKENLKELFDKLSALSNSDILVVSGSTPACLPDDIYEQILKYVEVNGCKTVVDATGSLLTKVLKYHPFLIKPNNFELSQIFNTEIISKDDVVIYAKKLQEQGARNVLVSMAGDGAVLVDEDGNIYQSEAPKGTVVNSVGAGDSMVAGFLSGYIESDRDYQHAFLKGVAAGSASAFSSNLCTKEEVDSLLKALK